MESVSKTEVTIFYNLITEATSLPFCRILSIKSKSPGPTQARGEGVIQGHEYEEAGIIGATLEVCLLQMGSGFSQGCGMGIQAKFNHI